MLSPGFTRSGKAAPGLVEIAGVHEAFSQLHPIVASWCERALREPTPPQADAIALGIARRNTLICSPTGTGKTLAAFLPVMSALAALRDDDALFPRTHTVYVSPLRALGYDVEHNIRRPLREMGLLERPNSERARLRKGRIRETFVRTGVRTGDTPVEERRLMLRRPPHVLITTPESLAVMLAMESYRRGLGTVQTVIVDEVHALAGNKRGVYLSLFLELLDELCEVPPARIGLSATVAPLERVASFLAGTDRECAIVDARGLRSIRLGIVAPFAGAMAPLATVARAALELGQDVRSSLVFTNVRSQAERIAHEMREICGRDDIAHAEQSRERRYDARIGVHHSALQRSVRHRVEARLRSGELRTVVCSSSLELGVDIGYVDRVMLVGGARGVTPTLQRVGRAGHRPGAIADGIVIAQDRDDIIEAAATKRCIADGVLEEIEVPAAPLDVLAQWMVASVCYDRRRTLTELLQLARRAYPYAALAESDLRSCAAYLSGGGAGGEEAHVRRLGFDGQAVYGLGREVCSAFFENVGTIPDEQHVKVRTGGGEIGHVEDDFASELREGDIFVLNARTLRVRDIGRAGITVEPSSGRPTVPAWSSQMKGVPLVLAREIAALRGGVESRLRAGGPQAALGWLRQRYSVHGAEAAHVVRYIAQQLAVSIAPTERRPVVEIYRMNRRQSAVFHTGVGRRINETLARAVAARIIRIARMNSQITTDDSGFLVTLPAGKRLADAQWAALLDAEGFEEDLLAGLRSSHLLRQHFRYVANTGLLVLRRAGGKSLRRRSLQWNARRIFDRLYAAERDFPLLRETIRTVTHDLLDAPGAARYLANLEGEPRVVHPAAASPFTFGIVTSSFGDSVVMDDRTAMVEALHERVLELLGEKEPVSDELSLLARIR